MNVIKDFEIILNMKNAKMPKRATMKSAGYDIFADRQQSIPASSVRTYELPFKFSGQLDEDLEIRVFVRSSFGMKKNLRLVENGDKNINYVILEPNNYMHKIDIINDGIEPLLIGKDEHFAQFVICEKHSQYEKMFVKDVPQIEKQKHKILLGHMVESNNLYEYVLDQDLTFEAREQKKFATGLRCLIEESTWTAITAHPDVKGRVLLANQTAVIDQDYAYTDNYGHCFVSFVNLDDKCIVIPKGTKLMSWFTKKYFIMENEIETKNVRIGGIGSTT